MKPNGRRAWRKAAKKLRWKMGRRWRSQEEWVHGKRWSELVPDLESHRGHITGAWFRRRGFHGWHTESQTHFYIGLSGTVDGESIGFAALPVNLTARHLVGMTMGARKRAWEMMGYLRSDLRIGERLRPCLGCFDCAVECWVCHEPHEPPDELCGGSGVIRAGKLRPLLRKPDCGFYID